MEHLDLAAASIALLLSGFLIAGAWGWGSLILHQSLQPQHQLPISVTTLVGFSALTLALGALSLAGLASGLVASAIFAGGMLARGWTLLSASRSQTLLAQIKAINPWTLLLIAAASSFMLITCARGEIFNLHDDFGTYFLPPSRLAQSGFFFDARDAFQPSAANGQAILQSIVWYWLGVHYVNTLDLFIFYLLTLLTLDNIGRLLGTPTIIRLLAITLAISIHPQYVNSTALYATAAFALGAIYTLLHTFTAPGATHHAGQTRLLDHLPFALLIAALMAAKVTNLPFALLLVCLYILLLFAFQIRSRVTASVVILGSIMTATLVLWILMPSSVYDSIWYHLTDRIDSLIAIIHAGDSNGLANSALSQNIKQLLSMDDLYWGANYPTYHSLLLVIWLGVAAIWPVTRRSQDVTTRRIWPIALGLATAATLAYLSGIPLQPNRPDLVVRYAIPVLIAVTPAMVLLSWTRTSVTATRSITWHRFALSLLTVSALVSIWLFRSELMSRVEQQIEYHTPIAFGPAINPWYRNYMTQVLSAERRETMRLAQESIPQEAHILAWTSTSFQLDFQRNPIAVMDHYGARRMNKRLRDLPPQTAVRDDLCARGIHYLIVEYKGRGMKFTEDEDLRWLRSYFHHFSKSRGRTVFHSPKDSLIVLKNTECPS